jgi:hypothetical protein
MLTRPPQARFGGHLPPTRNLGHECCAGVNLVSSENGLQMIAIACWLKPRCSAIPAVAIFWQSSSRTVRCMRGSLTPFGGSLTVLASSRASHDRG